MIVFLLVKWVHAMTKILSRSSKARVEKIQGWINTKIKKNSNGKASKARKQNWKVVFLNLIKHFIKKLKSLSYNAVRNSFVLIELFVLKSEENFGHNESTRLTLFSCQIRDKCVFSGWRNQNKTKGFTFQFLKMFSSTLKSNWRWSPKKDLEMVAIISVDQDNGRLLIHHQNGLENCFHPSHST